MDLNGFSVENYLQSLRSSKPPWKCPKCEKFYRSYNGIEYHLINFDHSAPVTPINRLPHFRKSKLKFSKKKKNNRFNRRSPSPTDFLSPPRDTLTWAEAQQMVELEAEGKVFRLNISDKLDILSDSDEDSNDDQEPSVAGNSEKIENESLNNNAAKSAKSKLEKPNDTKLGKTSLMPTPLCGNGSANKKDGNALDLPKPSYRVLSNYDEETVDAPPRPSTYYRFIEKASEELEDEVEYDMDEEDAVWLELMNKQRENDDLSLVTDNQLELLMDRFEKESYFEQAKNGCSAQANQSLIDEDAVCCVCNDGECQNSNVILFCDMCNMAIHQECYGVPYIPEGQWLCRRCLQSPSSPVDCCLCPNRTGAFKQTDDGRWAHVVCALWVPEVGFGNTVFLEPIDGLKNVPPARWKLTCYICKQRNSGACIQCHRTNCYTAFHVTCAQQAGLYMKMEPVKKSGENGVTITVKKEAYCDVHTPANASPRQNRMNGQLSGDDTTNDKMKKARKLLAEKRLEIPQISIPYIPRERMSSISRLVNFQKRNSFMQRLLSYWTLKRQSRNGVPLLRRLQSHVHPHKHLNPEAESEQKHLMDQLKYWQRLRHDLERARLLIELLRKREKLKREVVRISQVISEYRLIPFVILLRRLLAKLSAIDTVKVFAEPVKEADAPDYYKLIKSPMDFATMAAKVENCEYTSLKQFEDDFNLIISNCILYNGRDNVYYRFATKLRVHGDAVIRAAKREIARTGYDASTGMLLQKTPEKKVEQVIDDEKRLSLPLKQQLDIMLVRFDQAALHGRKTKKLRLEIAMLKRRIARENNLALSGSAKSDQSEPDNATQPPSDIADDSTDAKSSDPIESSSAEIDASSPKEEQETSTTHRKRLWSERWSSSSSESSVKKRVLERSGSCPLSDKASDGASLPNDVSATSSEPAAETATAKCDRPQSPDCSRSASLPPSPNRESVNRRSAVLFNKKPRSLTPRKTHSDPHLDTTAHNLVANATDTTTSDTEKVTPREDASASRPALPSTSETNSVNSHISGSRDETKSEESFHNYREETRRGGDTSDSDDQTSGSSSNDENCGVNGKEKPSPSRICSDQSDVESLREDDDSPSLIFGRNSAAPKSGTQRSHYASASEDDMDDDGDDMIHIAPLNLVWAKCRGYPPYPALLIDPKMPRSGYCDNGVPIPVPPFDVLQAGMDKRKENGDLKIYLVLFFDTKRTWQWLPRNKLQLLGVDEKADQSKLAEGRRPGIRKNVEAAYRRALLHRSRVTGDIPDSDDEMAVKPFAIPEQQPNALR